LPCLAGVGTAAADVARTPSSCTPLATARPTPADDAVADLCRCHLPLDPPVGQHWWPSRDPEPDPTVTAVAMHGQTPAHLRAVRTAGGWRTAGSLTNHPGQRPPSPWPVVGTCWAGQDHPVVDATG